MILDNKQIGHPLCLVIHDFDQPSIHSCGELHPAPMMLHRRVGFIALDVINGMEKLKEQDISITKREKVELAIPQVEYVTHHVSKKHKPNKGVKIGSYKFKTAKRK